MPVELNTVEPDSNGQGFIQARGLSRIYWPALYHGGKILRHAKGVNYNKRSV